MNSWLKLAAKLLAASYFCISGNSHSYFPDDVTLMEVIYVDSSCKQSILSSNIGLTKSRKVRERLNIRCLASKIQNVENKRAYRQSVSYKSSIKHSRPI